VGAGDAGSIRERLAAVDWAALEAALAERGHARIPALLAASECAALAGLYRDARRFRATIDMARFRFGAGEYRYFDYPLPPLVQVLRGEAYRRLAPIANRWMAALGVDRRYPRSLDGYLALCRRAGQRRPTPLLLRYAAGGYNCLHQDVYGSLGFPLQLACFLSRPEIDYGGGEFLLVEQHPRSQSRGEALRPGQGEAIVFPNVERPVRGRRGCYRARVRHGVSRLAWGERYTLGIIFHDAC
jgi:hypothetical protein